MGSSAPLVREHCRRLGLPYAETVSSTPTHGPCAICTTSGRRCVPETGVCSGRAVAGVGAMIVVIPIIVGVTFFFRHQPQRDGVDWR